MCHSHSLDSLCPYIWQGHAYGTYFFWNLKNSETYWISI
jgi:hypothetical protein